MASLRAAGNAVIVFDQPYNTQVPGLRARTWAEVEEITLGRMADAGITVQQPLPVGDPDRVRRLTER